MYLFLVLTVALLNFGLGYVLAVKLGLGPPSWADAWAALTAARPAPPQDPPDEVAPEEEAAAANGDSAGWLLQELVLPPDWKETGEEEEPNGPGAASGQGAPEGTTGETEAVTEKT